MIPPPDCGNMTQKGREERRVRLSELIRDLACRTEGGESPEIADIVIDSRKVSPGSLFVCIRGARHDGHEYAAEAVARGAAALVAEREIPGAGVPQALVDDSRDALSRLASAYYGHPSRGMELIGVTGTKGKTTTTWLIRDILSSVGEKTGLIGTVVNKAGDEVIAQHLTTPDPMELQGLLRRMADAGCRRVVMEVSAHALALRKLAGLSFRAGVFTNLTQDHLDDFGTMENYRAAKRRFFTDYEMQFALSNADDRAGRDMIAGFPGVAMTYGIDAPADFRAEGIRMTWDGIAYTLCAGALQTPVRLPLPGRFNVRNSLAAAAVALELGLSLRTVAGGLMSAGTVPGRFERVNAGSQFSVVVDYAHSPDSIRSILEAVRELTPGRVIAVFGCGGDRDRTKRPVMGRIAGEGSDYVILTSDNPRTEDPEAILDMIEPGVRETGAACERIADRRAAIARALSVARKGDTVVVAGKGHERYQEIMGVRRPFDDRETVLELLKEKGE